MSTGVATVVSREDFSETTKMVFEAPHALARFIAFKGSVAIDGTSLTVNGVDGDRFDCLFIPHTLQVTTWGERQPGDNINLEVDTIARYVRAPSPRRSRRGGRTAGRSAPGADCASIPLDKPGSARYWSPPSPISAAE